MDYTVLYVIGTAIFVVLFSIVIKILIDKKILTKEVVSFVAKTFNLTSKVVDELNLKKEKQILMIADIVNDSIEYILAIMDNPNFMVDEAYNYAVDKCLAFGIELTDNRREILLHLITAGLNLKIAKDDEVV